MAPYEIPLIIEDDEIARILFSFLTIHMNYNIATSTLKRQYLINTKRALVIDVPVESFRHTPVRILDKELLEKVLNKPFNMPLESLLK